jgi:hypothetical protein
MVQELDCPTRCNSPKDGARPAIQFSPSELGDPDCGKNSVWCMSSAVRLVAIFRRMEQGPPFSSAHLSLVVLIVAITLCGAGARLSDLWQYSGGWSEARLTLSLAVLIVAITLYGAGARLSDLWQYSGGWSEAAS